MADPTQLPPVAITVPGRPAIPRGMQTFRPKVSVVLLKNIGRVSAGGGAGGASERFSGSKRRIDLTPYLGDAGSVTVSKSVRQAAGMFSIVLADKMNPDAQDSLYGLIEPLDVVEIRMARDPSAPDYAGLDEHMPIMMRGFVADVRRRQTMSDRGPRRTVTITGQDYGKMLQMMRITYLPGMVLGEYLLSAYRFAMNYQVDAKPYDDAAAFVEAVLQNVIWPFQDAMGSAALAAGGPGSTSPILRIGADVDAGGNGAVFPYGTSEWDGGSVDDMLRYFGDVGPWNELYVEDREADGDNVAGPYLVYRPTPFKTLDGNLIQAMKSPPKPPIIIRDNELVELDCARSEQNVANYFWVDAPRYNLIDGGLIQAGAQAAAGGYGPNPFLVDYQNSDPKLYGIRLMRLQTQQGFRLDGLSEAKQTEQSPQGLAMCNAKRQVLLDNNRDAVVYESGSMTLRGNERVRAGMYLNLMRGGSGANTLTAEHYVHTVTHQFAPFHVYTTMAEFDRGTGFVERIARGGGQASPYLAEMNVKGTGL